MVVKATQVSYQNGDMVQNLCDDPVLIVVGYKDIYCDECVKRRT